MKNIKIKDITIMSILLALLIISSKISFNIGPIPITLQTFMVFLISLLLGPKKGSIVMLTYIIMGLIGIPVFSGGGGFDYIFKPSFGFIIGFFFASLVIGIKRDVFYAKYITTTIGLLIINLCGIIYMYLIMNYYLMLDKSISYILEVGVLPFIFKDFVVVILTCILYSRINVAINKKEYIDNFNQNKSTKESRWFNSTFLHYF